MKAKSTTLPRLHLDAASDANGFQTIRPDDGTEHGDTEMNPIATVYAGPETGAQIVRAVNGYPGMLKALRRAEGWMEIALAEEPEDYDNKAMKRDLKQIRKAIKEATV